MQQKKKRESWIKTRHKVVTAVLKPIIGTYTRWKFGIDVHKFKEQGDRQYLVVLNHQTTFDQFFVAMAFNGPIYFIATEDIFSLGWLSRLLVWAIAPIPIKKQTSDLKAVKTCLRVAKEGGTIALAPEGNRTYSGRTVYMKPSVAKLAKMLRLPVAVFRIEEGYGVQPRWSDAVRKGRMKAYVSRVIEPEEYKELSDEEFFAVIEKELHVDENCLSGRFEHKNLAEYMERSLHVCPDCGFAVFESHGDIVKCKTCGKQVRYLPTKEMEGVNCQFPFRFFGEWYDYQSDYINSTDVTKLTDSPVFTDTANLSEVILYDKKHLIKENVTISLYGDRVVFGDILTCHFDDTSTITVLGKNKANIYYNDKVYQLKGDKRFNALKYVHIFNRYKNIKEGNADGKFLGL